MKKYQVEEVRYDDENCITIDHGDDEYLFFDTLDEATKEFENIADRLRSDYISGTPRNNRFYGVCLNECEVNFIDDEEEYEYISCEKEYNYVIYSSELNGFQALQNER